MRISALFVLLMVLFVQCVYAEGTVSAPKLVAGQFVYAVPAWFDPPLVGRAGMAELNSAVQKLHYPFYIVFAQNLSGGGDEDARAKAATDGLAEAWAASGGYDVGKSQVFVLSYNPRKYSFLAGGDFKAKLGFEKAAHQPYLALFERHIRGTPKNPKQGLWDMMASVDNYLFQNTDPATVAARVEAERKAAEARAEETRKAEAARVAAALAAEKERKLQGARGMLDEQLLRLNGLLSSSCKEDLPSDVSQSRVLYGKAYDVRQRDNPEEMAQMAASMKGSVDVLAAYVGGKELARRVEQGKAVSLILMGFVILASICALLLRRRAYRWAMKALWERQYKGWRERISNATEKYVNSYNDRGQIMPLSEMKGKTKELFDFVTALIDEIVIGVKAMSERLDEAESVAKADTAEAYKKAVVMLDSEFDFNTGQMDEKSLFSNGHRIVKITPASLMNDMQTKFSRAVDSWKRLRYVADLRLQPIEKLFPNSDFDALVARAQEHSIPVRWLSDHPLAGDDEADRKIWSDVASVQWEDPVLYVEKLEALREKAIATKVRLDKLIEIRTRVAKLELPKSAFECPISLSPEEDPAVTLDVIQRETDKFYGRLASSQQIEEIENKAAELETLAKKCRDQFEVARQAIQSAKNLAREANLAQSKSHSLKNEAVAANRLAAQVHRNLKSQKYIDNADLYLAGAEDLYRRAETALRETRYSDARKNAKASLDKFEAAQSEYTQALKHIRALDEKKAEYEKAVREASATRSAYNRKIAEYGRSITLNQYSAPSIGNGAVDYCLLLDQYRKTENEWESAQRRARQEYEEELAAQRRAEAARRAEEERQRYHSFSSYSSSYSSYSSSSSSSWSSSDSSSSSGSWGGCDSSSSSGSW